MTVSRTGGVLLAAVLLLACATGKPSPAPSRRVVLVSFDGIGADRLALLLSDPRKLNHGGFRRLLESGFSAERCIPPTPSTTAVTHATIATGARPQDTGVVANWMLDRSRPFGSVRSGFDASLRAEPIWEAARRQGRRVGNLFYPFLDGTTPRRRVDWSLSYPGAPISRPDLLRPAASDWALESPSDPRLFSIRRAFTARLSGTAHRVRFVAIDERDDGVESYDALTVETDSGAARKVRSGEWFPVEVRDSAGRTGAWCKVFALASDLSSAEIYVGGLNRNSGYPEQFRREVDDRLGFWPGAPDKIAFGASSERPEAFLEQADRMAGFLSRAEKLALERRDWDLLLLYHPEVDQVSHELLLQDPAQPGFSPDRSRRLLALVEGAYELADRALAAVYERLSTSDSLFVTSDHGMFPTRATLYPNAVLRAAGLLTVSKGKADSSSRAFAAAGGGIAHVYANPQSRDPALLPGLERLFREFRVAGHSPWERILRRDQAGDEGLAAPESGDLILLAEPGYLVSPRLPGPGITSGPPIDLGGHGFRNVHRALDAIFLASGPGVSRSRVPTIDARQIAGRIAAALGIASPGGPR